MSKASGVLSHVALIAALLSTPPPALAQPPAATPAPALPDVLAMAPNTAAGTGTFTGQTLRITHGLAWVSGEKFEVALFDRVPAAGMLAELKTGSWGDAGPVATSPSCSMPGRASRRPSATAM